MTDGNDQTDTDRDMWVYILMYDRHHPLTRFILGVAVCAIIVWILIRMLTP